MIHAALKLVVITLITLILAVFAVLGVRGLNSGSQFEAPENPWFKSSFWWIYQPSLEQLCKTADIETLTPTKDWIIELPVRHVGEDWAINCPGNAQKIGDFLKASKHRDWLIDVQAQDTWGLDLLSEKLNSLLPKYHFGLTTRSQKVAVYLRKKAPGWLFAADNSSVVRLRLFESFYLETAVEFWPDFLISNFKADDPYFLDDRAIAELHRRKKRVLWQWYGKADDSPPSAIDGILTNRPTEAMSKFSSSH